MNNNFKSGFISIVGRTNVGKSTLLNLLLGQKISIVSNRPQTTRNNIRCIRTTGTSQMVFIDTPGFHKPKSKLSDYMVEVAGESYKEVDVILFLVEEDTTIGKGDEFLIEKLKKEKTPVILVINKIDKITKEEILGKIKLYEKYDFIKEIVPISAMKGENINELVEVIEKYLPQGPMYFPEDMVTDRSERFVISELIREKILRSLKEEIPHGTAVEVMLMKKRNNKDLYDIEANIYTERENHKRIIIGKNGSMLKKIGSDSRREIEEMLGTKVNLKLWVKVKDEWRDKQNILNSLGYNKKDEL
ncbi:ribosome biogenesis GTPase Era [Anaerofustis stercorihominis DSM 17244]|uniref:GTPase Era n=1 Tax=Anaerofustis stercorihominis DSM 17244 TaxID=445971 RepID=B1C5L7_9FIRM|nr:GTPase Era [Anaerofustis stercorihominis]EDS73649.1 ribosome biogenesis GTPase Era [Anaerofustis stercorihominis DSM 17244]